MKLFNIVVLHFIFISCTTNKNIEKIYATAYMQNAAEVTAIHLQVFNSARAELIRLISEKKLPKNPVIIVDVDETVLNNTPYEAKNILKNESYPKGWEKWVSLARAEKIMGSVNFIKFAQSKGVKTFYITNRREVGRKATLKNLINLGFPVSDKFLIMRTDQHSKTKRRELVKKKHNPIMYFGDNLSDFSDEFNQKKGVKRADIVLKYKDLFGKKFFILPNPMYGDWINYKNLKNSLKSF